MYERSKLKQFSRIVNINLQLFNFWNCFDISDKKQT